MWVGTWEENITGVLRTHYNNAGVTEFQMIAIAVVVSSAIFGPQATQLKIYGNITVLQTIVYSVFIR